MGSKKEPPIIGYRYYLGMHQVYSLSPASAPITAVKKIKVGDKEAWTGNVTATGQISINAPDLFGGDGKEGGIVGAVDIEFGGVAQGLNSYLQAKCTGYPLPAFRGLLGLVLRCPQVSAMNPYIKPWMIFASRINGGFYPAKAAIGTDMNPAHIIYETLTNHEFGIGIASSDIDTASFTYAADMLYTEGLGLSLFWNGEQDAEAFIDYILKHIDGVIYIKPSTGLFTLKLARADYVVGDLPILDTSNIIRVDRLSQPLPGELVSEVQVKYEDRETGEAGSVNVHDIAIMEIQGGHSTPTVRDYQGIPTGDLAAKIAARELRALATPLITCEITCNRQAWNLNIGDVFRLQYPPLGIADAVMRVASLDYGTLTDGKIVVEAIQDVFTAADTAISTPPATGWISPWNAPAPCPASDVIEAPYWVVAREILGEMDSLLADVNPESGLVLTMGSRPSHDAYNYAIYSGTSTLEKHASGPFCAAATLATAIGRADTVLAISGGVDLDTVEADSWAYLNGEILKVVSVTETTLTVKRGILDTTANTHTSGTVFFAGDSHGIDLTEWANGQTINVRLLPRTGLGSLLLASAPNDSVKMARRFIRPYPPGYTRINGTEHPTSVSGDLSITWVHRDRTLQTAYLVEQTEASIGPEVGTTYTVRIYNAQTGGTLIRTYSSITGTSQAYTDAQATTDNGGTKPANLRIEIESVRDTYTSWQRQVRAFAWG